MLWTSRQPCCTHLIWSIKIRLSNHQLHCEPISNHGSPRKELEKPSTSSMVTNWQVRSAKPRWRQDWVMAHQLLWDSPILWAIDSVTLLKTLRLRMVQRSIKLFSHRCVRIGHVQDVRLTLGNKHRSSTLCMLAQTRRNRLWQGRNHRRLCLWWAGPVHGCRPMQASRVGKTKRLQMRRCSSPLALSTRCTPYLTIITRICKDPPRK